MMRVALTGRRGSYTSHYRFPGRMQGRWPGLIAGVVAVVMIFGILLAGPGLAGAQVTANDGFNPNASRWVSATAFQPDGKILVGGAFTIISGGTRHLIARLHPDGSLDTSFNPNASNTVGSLAVHPDGKILLGGWFTSIGGASRIYIAQYISNILLSSRIFLPCME